MANELSPRPRQALRGARLVLSFLWAALPALSLGMLTPAVFMYAAVRLRSALVGVATALYAAAWITMYTTAGGEGTIEDLAFQIAFLVGALGGGTHALLIRRRVFSPVRRRPRPAGAGPDHLARAEDWVRSQRATRERARAIIASDVAMAREIGIGRPDLARGVDDGGLVDINHAPPTVLAMLPGLTPALVAQIVSAREHGGGFESVADLVVFADLPPDVVDKIAEYAVFIP